MAALLDDEAIRAALEKLDGWARAGDALTKTFSFRDFAEAMEFVNRAAEEAEAADHHPDMDIRYNKVSMTLSTHSAAGLTAKDTHLAERLNASAKPNL